MTTSFNELRLAAAEAALMNHDFGDAQVSEMSGWSCDRIEYQRTIFFANPDDSDGATVKGHFTVTFESQGSATVRDSYAIINGNFVGPPVTRRAVPRLMQVAPSHPLLLKVRNAIGHINVDDSIRLVNNLMEGFWLGNNERVTHLLDALRLCAEDRCIADQFRADAVVWKALTALSGSIHPATELSSAKIEQRGSFQKWIAIHADVDHGGFIVYEKENDCDRESGSERRIARHDTFISALSDVNDRALVSSLQEEPSPRGGCA